MDVIDAFLLHGSHPVQGNSRINVTPKPQGEYDSHEDVEHGYGAVDRQHKPTKRLLVFYRMGERR